MPERWDFIVRLQVVSYEPDYKRLLLHEIAILRHCLSSWPLWKTFLKRRLSNDVKYLYSLEKLKEMQLSELYLHFPSINLAR